MNGRNITSLTMLVSLVLSTVTSLILYLTPYGRVAYWSDWHLWGLSKTEWSNLHLNLGILFLITGFIHVYYNWSAIKKYFYRRTQQFFTLDFGIALLICVIIGIGTYHEIPPMGSTLNLGIAIKDRASDRYGEPPYGHAELSSLKMFSARTGLDPAEAMNLLREQKLGIIGETDTIQEIAKNNNLTPKEIYRIIEPASTVNPIGGTCYFPDSPPPGFGTKSPAMLGKEYGLNVEALLAGLQSKGIQAEPEQSIKRIAAANELEPMTVFEMIRNFVTASQSQ